MLTRVLATRESTAFLMLALASPICHSRVFKPSCMKISLLFAVRHLRSSRISSEMSSASSLAKGSIVYVRT